MDSTNDYAVNRLKILSDDQSYNVNTGALIVKGGIAAGKAISAPCINVDTLHIKENTIISGDLTINTLTFDKLIPKCETSTIGSCSNRVHEIYTNYIDTNTAFINDSIIANTVKTNKLIVGDDSCNHKDPSLTVDNQNRLINININTLNVCDNNTSIMSLNKSNILFDTLLKINYQNLMVTQQSYSLFPTTSLIIINSTICTTITINSSGISDKTYIKIYNKSCNCICINSCNVASGGSIEFLYIKNSWVALTGVGSSTTPCDDSGCGDVCDTTTDCNSSVFTVDNSHV